MHIENVHPMHRMHILQKLYHGSMLFQNYPQYLCRTDGILKNKAEKLHDVDNKSTEK